MSFSPAFPTILTAQKKYHKNERNKNEINVIEKQTLTGDDQSSFGSAQSSFARQPMFRTALIALVSILGTYGTNVQFSRRQYQVFTLCIMKKKTISSIHSGSLSANTFSIYVMRINFLYVNIDWMIDIERHAWNIYS